MRLSVRESPLSVFDWACLIRSTTCVSQYPTAARLSVIWLTMSARPMWIRNEAAVRRFGGFGWADEWTYQCVDKPCDDLRNGVVSGGHGRKQHTLQAVQKGLGFHPPHPARQDAPFHRQGRSAGTVALPIGACPL
jgi:hypothetical protein